MNFKNLYVIEELFQLSQISDEIIDKAYSDTSINDNFFEDVKKEVHQILNNKISGRKCSGRIRKNSNFRNEMDHSLEPFLETRSHVHTKLKSEMQDKISSTVTPANLNERSYRYNDSKISNSLSSDTEICIEKSDVHCSNMAIQGEVCKELYLNQKLDDETNSMAIFQSYSSPSNSKKCKRPLSTRTCKSKESSPFLSESEIKPSQVEETVIISSSEDGNSLSTSQGILTKTFCKFGSNAKSKEKENVYLDERKDNVLRSPDASVIILDKTYTVSTGSSVENNDFTTSVSSTSVISCDSSGFSLNTREKHKRNTRFKKYLIKANVESLKDQSSRSFIENGVESPAEETVHEVTQTRLSTLKARSGLKFCEGGAVSLKKQKIAFHYQGKRTCSFNSSSEEEAKLSGIQPRLTYRLRSLENKSGDDRCTTKKLRMCTDCGIVENQLADLQNENVAATVQESKLSVPTIVTQCSQLTNFKEFESYISTHSKDGKFSAIKQSSKILNSESDKSRPKPIIHQINLAEEVKISIKDSGSRKFLRKSVMNKKYPKQVRTLSAPVNTKRNNNRNPRSNTPIEFVTCNSHSLKAKAEEKRLKRELRVRKTKERRERLEREREERIRVKEQRLKKRFQKHEEILKGKTEKFKIKSRNLQHCYSKRSAVSASSKDSKEDKTKDNDDSCRNAVNSGQKLSKKSNGYCDVSLEKADLASLEGNVGLHPKISKKQKAILVGCEETPVEFLVSCDGTELKKFETISAKQKVVSFEDFKAPALELEMPINSPHLRCLKNSYLEETSICSKENSLNKSIKKSLKRNFVNSDEGKSRTPCFKRINRISVAPDSSKKIQNTYLLRSAVKQNRNKELRNIFAFSLEEEDCNRHKSSIQGYANPDVSGTITSSSEGENKTCNKFCFKMRTNKPKKNVKLYNCINNGSEVKTIQIRSMKLEDSSEKVKRLKPKKIIVSKKHAINSYEIPDIIDDSFEETEVDPRKIPSWATGIHLKQALLQQFYKPPNLKEIFGVLPKEPLELIVLFAKDKPEYHRRTSSDNWDISTTPL